MSVSQRIADLRKEYAQDELDIQHVLQDPLAQFQQWFDEAYAAEVPEPNAMTLATANESGIPNARIVLLKGVDDTGFVFYTNYESQKGQELKQNPYASLVFYWHELERQVRINGGVAPVPSETSDAYFNSRPAGSRLGAWASPQSQPITDKQVIWNKLSELEKTYPDEAIPRPAHWGGYRLTPSFIEFWQGRPNRLHDRIAFTWESANEKWRVQRLAP
jgi:pyridoxamine 5'-phosphate oxidase